MYIDINVKNGDICIFLNEDGEYILFFYPKVQRMQ
jgi:hypothetical protein